MFMHLGTFPLQFSLYLCDMKENEKPAINADKLLLATAFIFLIIGFIILIWFVLDYNFGYNDIKYKMKLGDLGTILSGTVGLLWSLASVLFFIYNLSQQREALKLQKDELKNQIEEMKLANATATIQQKAISDQTSNSLFYKLLQNNTKLFKHISPVLFNEVKNTITQTIKNYKPSVQNRCFIDIREMSDSANSVGYNPPYRFMRKYGTSGVLESYIDNVMDVIEFIESKLNGEEFYHRMFYNQLSYPEKYFIGFVFEFGLFDSSKIKTAFNYSTAYKSSTEYYSFDDGYFPVVNISIPTDSFSSYILYKHESGNTPIKFELLEDLLGKKLVFLGVFIELSSFGPASHGTFSPINFKKKFNMDFDSNFVVDMVDFFENFDFKKLNSISNCYLKMTFVFTYDGIQYSIKMGNQLGIQMPIDS